MPLSWNEITHRAIAFAREWAGEEREQAEAKSFWDAFFDVFGIRRRTVATFEEPVKRISGKYGYIDLFWAGVLIAEHKSRGKDLDRAHTQAIEYLQDLAREGRQEESPRYILVSDFARIGLHDLEEGTSLIISLSELHRHIHAFAFIPGYKQHKLEPEDPINIRAVELMGDLHDTLEEGGFNGHDLERFLVRVLFCLFADDTGIFERSAFQVFLENGTRQDGSDMGERLSHLFEVMNTPEERRQKNLDALLAVFPYVNGQLFAERLAFPSFDIRMRQTLLRCTHFDWSRISPAVFGSLFQSVMEPRARRQVGGHYTSERDILKVVRSLFLDDLRLEFEKCKKSKPKLLEFHGKLGGMRFFDPACGCGNFLVVTYRELRLLEIEVLLAIHGKKQQMLDIQHLSLVDVDAMYGIEIQEWPARIAEVALWLMDHQMNLRLSEVFGHYYIRLPLKKSPTIVYGNALRLDWMTVLPPAECSYVLGNPPFVGKQFRTEEQEEDVSLVWGQTKGHGLLDYVTCWYQKAAEYIQGTRIGVAFVSTNSITQGEQVGILWRELFSEWGIKIHFGYRTFPWESEARGKAHVHVVIIGFGAFDQNNKRIYENGYNGGNGGVTHVRNISPYLIEGGDSVVLSRAEPLCDVPEIVFGNMPNDGGNLILSSEEKARLLEREPGAESFIRPFVGAQEFINGEERWCLWLVEASPKELRRLPEVMVKIAGVREHRLKSKRQTTRDLAETPSLFGEIRQPQSDYLLIPSVSSERRRYIPIGFMDSEVIGSNLVLFVPEATLYHFGVLSSAMHMAWVRQVCGRLKSDVRYSNKLVYNTFPWPRKPTSRWIEKVLSSAERVLAVRKEYSNCSLADLYDPAVMPSKLTKAHASLDKAVDHCYRTLPFRNDLQRIEYLFHLYEELTTPMLGGFPDKRR